MKKSSAQLWGLLVPSVSNQIFFGHFRKRLRTSDRSIYFAPDHWRKGYGTQCMSFILSNVVEAGYRKLILWALKGNLIGSSFYTKLGFLQDGRERKVKPDLPVTEVCFYKLLG